MRPLSPATREGVALEDPAEVLIALEALEARVGLRATDSVSQEEVLIRRLLDVLNNTGMADRVRVVYGINAGAIVLGAVTEYARGPREDPDVLRAWYMLQEYNASIN